ncbi:MAG: NAD-dependent epimerase/dehydratase family protein, partial [Candidatus Aminicenantes bacterium]
LKGDLSDKSSLLNAVEGVRYVYHLAAILGSSETNLIFRVNHEGTRNLVNICLENCDRFERFLFVSSHAVMGPTSGNRIFNEEDDCHPVSDYGKSKLLAEEYLRSVNGQIPYTIVRLPVVYGPRSLKGFYSAFKLLKNRVHIDFRKGESNVGFVCDMVEGIIAASTSSKTLGKTYFLGEKRTYSMKELFEAVQKAVGKKALKIKIPYFVAYLFAYLSEWYAGINGGHVLLFRHDIKYPHWRMDVSKAEGDFGFETKTPFDEGIRITADWYRENGYL